MFGDDWLTLLTGEALALRCESKSLLSSSDVAANILTDWSLAPVVGRPFVEVAVEVDVAGRDGVKSVPSAKVTFDAWP